MRRNRILIGLLVMIMTLGVAINASASAPAPPSFNDGPPEGCIYKSTHGKHNPHASNFEFKIYVTPDYSVGQMLQNSFYACEGCNYCCCVVYQHFGNLITETPDESGLKL